jgi:hypothetical protein
LSDATVEIAATYGMILEDTLTMSDAMADAKRSPLETDYLYYVGSYLGKIYALNEDIQLDDGATFESCFISKNIDGADQIPEFLSRYKTLYKARLIYVDRESTIPVAMSTSTDGGTTWTTRTANLGTGTMQTQWHDFWFHNTGHNFMMKISTEAVGDFQWLALELYFNDAGDLF